MNTGLRLVIYLVKRITAIIVIIFLVAMAFAVGYDCANVYVVLNDGLTQQSSVVFDHQDTLTLNDFFTHNYITSSPILNDNPFQTYNIKNYDQRIKIKWLWVWPWKDTAKVVVDEEILNITGEQLSTDQEAETQEKAKPPEWKSGEKVIVMKKFTGRWKIDDILPQDTASESK